MTKRCSKCSKEKNISEFYKNISKYGGYDYWCKECCRQNKREHYAKNKDRLRKESRDRCKKSYPKNKESKSLYAKRHRANNKEEYKERSQKYYKENKECISQHKKEYRAKNKEQVNEYRRKWSKNNRIQNPRVRLNEAMSASIYHSLKNGFGKNGRHWETILYYNIDELKIHTESLFLDGMTWDNYGEWHIHHCIPVSLWKFESYNDKEFKQCWSLCNLEPLWAKENIKRGNKIL